MKWDETGGRWNDVKGRAKQWWGEFTDDELERLEGKRDELIGRIQKQYGKSREEAEREVREFEKSL